LVRTNVRGVEENALFIELDLQALEDLLPVLSPRPQSEAVVDGLPRPKPRGEISPRRTGFQAIEDRIDEEALT
jgi:hypothetical protein